MTDPSHRKGPRPRSSYKHISAITTRWMDNDAYGHINNVVYYSFFDTVVNRYLIEGGFLDIGGGEVIGLVVETACRYTQPIAFPEAVTAGLRVAHIGNARCAMRSACSAAMKETPPPRGISFTSMWIAKASVRRRFPKRYAACCSLCSRIVNYAPRRLPFMIIVRRRSPAPGPALRRVSGQGAAPAVHHRPQIPAVSE